MRFRIETRVRVFLLISNDLHVRNDANSGPAGMVTGVLKENVQILDRRVRILDSGGMGWLGKSALK